MEGSVRCMASPTFQLRCSGGPWLKREQSSLGLRQTRPVCRRRAPNGTCAPLNHTVYDPKLAEAALAWARENLKPQFRGQAFSAEIRVPDTAPAYDRLVAFFGRQPH